MLIVQDSGVLAKYRQRILQETAFVNLPGMLFRWDRSGNATSIEFPLNQLYIHIQALQEEHRHVADPPETQVEHVPRDSAASDARLRDIVTTLSQSGEEFYRHRQVYRALERPEPIEPENALYTYHRLVLLGASGSGKTTLLQYLARNAATDPHAPAPILITLKDYAMYLRAKGRASLHDFAITRAARGNPGLRWPCVILRSKSFYLF